MKLWLLLSYYALLIFGFVKLNGGVRKTLRNWNWETCEFCKRQNIPKSDSVRCYTICPECTECEATRLT